MIRQIALIVFYAVVLAGCGSDSPMNSDSSSGTAKNQVSGSFILNSAYDILNDRQDLDNWDIKMETDLFWDSTAVICLLGVNSLQQGNSNIPVFLDSMDMIKIYNDTLADRLSRIDDSLSYIKDSLRLEGSLDSVPDVSIYFSEIWAKDAYSPYLWLVCRDGEHYCKLVIDSIRSEVNIYNANDSYYDSIALASRIFFSYWLNIDTGDMDFLYNRRT